MTPDLYACVDRCHAAERAGDLDAALEWHLSVPMFQRGRHKLMLEGLVDLGDPLPEWVWARLLAYLAMRCEDGRTGRLAQDHVRALIEVHHAELLDRCYEEHGDPVKVIAWVSGESWIVHQYLAHEAGVLESFLDEFATDRLAEHAELARSWLRAPLSGYELGESREGRLRVREAGAEAWVDVLDLGARTCTSTGWVLGRLVPDGAGGLMFDRHPLGVPAGVARAVADAGGAWASVMEEAIGDGRLAQDDVLREDYELTCDVPELAMLRYATPPHDLARVMMQLRGGRDEIGRAAYRILEQARRLDIAPADATYVGAALLNVHAFKTMRRDVVQTGSPGAWAAWRQLLPEPARRRAEELVVLGRSAA